MTGSGLLLCAIRVQHTTLYLLTIDWMLTIFLRGQAGIFREIGEFGVNCAFEAME